MKINHFIKQILERLKHMNEELVIDRYEENIAVCEDRKTGKIKKIDKSKIQEGIQEGTCIKLENGKYVKNEETQRKIEKEIKQKMDDVWKN